MKTKNWKQLASELKECIFSTERTEVDIIVEKDPNGNDDGIKVTPKYGDCLYCTEDIVDFCRVKRLHNYVGIECEKAYIRIH